MLPKNIDKNAKIKDFGLPKWTQNWTFFAYFREKPIFQKLCSRGHGSMVFRGQSVPGSAKNWPESDKEGIQEAVGGKNSVKKSSRASKSVP